MQCLHDPLAIHENLRSQGSWVAGERGLRDAVARDPEVAALKALLVLLVCRATLRHGVQVVYEGDLETMPSFPQGVRVLPLKILMAPQAG